jgi:diguanylate cyclase (GGDEF)-like protein
MLIFAGNAFFATISALGMHLLVFEDMTYELRLSNRELEAAQEELRRLATIDSLTGCYNRRFFEEAIEHELQRHRRYRSPLSIIFVDIDRFKSINDSYGHDAGDRVLKFVAEFLTKNVRDADYVIRWGGDEFLLLLTCEGSEAGLKVAALKDGFGEALQNQQLPSSLRLSIGYSEIPADASDIVPLIREADLSMYADKSKT